MAEKDEMKERAKSYVMQNGGFDRAVANLADTMAVFAASEVAAAEGRIAELRQTLKVTLERLNATIEWHTDDPCDMCDFCDSLDAILNPKNAALDADDGETK